MTTEHSAEDTAQVPLPEMDGLSRETAASPALASRGDEAEWKQGMLELNERLTSLSRSMEAATHVAERREGTISRLHDEVQALRSSEVHRATLPLLRDLVQLSDYLQEPPGDADSSTSDTLRPLREMIGDILYRYGVEKYSALAGEVFDAKLHRAVEAVDTEDDSLDRTIVGTTRTGFLREGRVVRLADVRVARLRRAVNAL